MAFDEKRYLDYAGLAQYDELIKKYIKDNATDSVLEIQKELETMNSSIETNASNIEALEAAVAKNAEDIATNAEAIAANAAALEILNGDEKVEGSVKNQVATAVNTIVDGAPEALDTLKEIAEWIRDDETGSSALVERVGGLEDAIGSAAVPGKDAVVDPETGDVIEEAVEAQPATGIMAELEKIKGDVASNLTLINTNIENIAANEQAIEDLRAYVDAEDVAVYDSIQAIPHMSVMSLFAVEQKKDETAAEAIAALADGGAVKLAADQEINDDIVIKGDCYIDANGSTFTGAVTVPADAEVIIENATFSNPVKLA